MTDWIVPTVKNSSFSLWAYALLALPLPGRLCAKTTSSTKPEVHKLLHCCQRRTKPRPQLRHTETFVKFGRVVFETCEWTDIHTYRHARHNTSHPCTGGRGNNDAKRRRFCCLQLCASVTKQYNLVPAKRRWCSAAGEVTAGLAESNGSLPPGGWLTVTCGWLPVHRDQLRAQRSVSSMGESFTFYLYIRWQWRNFFIPHLHQLFFRHDVRQALRIFCYCDITFLVILSLIRTFS